MRAKINPEKFNEPASKGDVAGVAIMAVIALGHIAEALEALSTESDTDAAVKGLKRSAESLRNMFEDLIMEDEG